MTVPQAAERLHAIHQQVASMQPDKVVAAAAELEELATVTDRLTQGEPLDLAAPLGMLRRSLHLARKMYGARVDASVGEQGGYTPVGTEPNVGRGRLEVRG